MPRGYAFVAADLAGTNRSTGCEDVGGRAEVLGAKAVGDCCRWWAACRARDRVRRAVAVTQHIHRFQ